MGLAAQDGGNVGQRDGAIDECHCRDGSSDPEFQQHGVTPAFEERRMVRRSDLLSRKGERCFECLPQCDLDARSPTRDVVTTDAAGRDGAECAARAAAARRRAIARSTR